MKRLIDAVDQEQMLRNAYRLIRRRREFSRGAPLRSFVQEITGHGSTVSSQICQELGWNPFAKIGTDLPARLPRPDPCLHPPPLLAGLWCRICNAIVEPSAAEKGGLV